MYELFFVYVCFFVFFVFFFSLSQLLVMSCFVCCPSGSCFVCFFLCKKMLVESEQSCFLCVCLMQGHSGYVCVLWVVALWNEWRSSVITWGGWTWCLTWSLTKSFWVGRLFGCFVTTCFKLFCVFWQLFHFFFPQKMSIKSEQSWFFVCKKLAKMIMCMFDELFYKVNKRAT